MVASSITFDLLPALVVTFEDAVAALDDVVVIDGDATRRMPMGTTYLFVGWNDPDSPRSTSVSSTQQWVGVGGQVQDEQGTVTCCIVRTVGDPDLSVARAAISPVLAAVKTVLRADPNLGGTVPGLRAVHFARFDLDQYQSDKGAVALCTFDIAYEARI